MQQKQHMLCTTQVMLLKFDAHIAAGRSTSPAAAGAAVMSKAESKESMHI
jgi:hypothetical protein